MSFADELEAAAVQLDAVARVGEQLGRVAAPAVEAVARAQWASGRAPDGAAWPPKKDGRGVPLEALTRQITVTPTDAEIRFEGPDELGYHARTRPALPHPGDDLPAPWREAADGAIARALEDAGR